MNPFVGIIKYIPVYTKYTGKKLYYLFILTTLVAFMEGVGLSMLMPLLGVIEGTGPPQNKAGRLFYNVLAYFGIQDSLIAILMVIGAIFVVKGLFFFFEGAYRGFIRARLLRILKSKMYTAYQLMDIRYYYQKNTGHFLNLINEQINQFVVSFTHIASALSNVFMTLTFIGFTIVISWEVALIALFAGMIFMFIFQSLNSWVRKISRKNATELGQLSKLLVQVIQSFKYSSATGQMGHLGTEVMKSVETVTSYEMKKEITKAFTHSLKEPLSMILVLGLIAYFVGFLGSPLGPIMVTLLLFKRVLDHIFTIQNSWQNVMTLIGSVELVDLEFNALNDHKELGGSINLGSLTKGIEFKDVSYSYEKNSASVFNNISIKIPVNKTIAIVGESGAGKSTLVDLLTLMLKPDTGKIVFDDVIGTEVELLSWRKQIGYVSQETVIFDDTIANNISMWNATNKGASNIVKIKTAASKAHIDNFIDSLENGYNTIVGDRGVRLSGGQRQRLFIARELFKDPQLLILDEATSSLDSESERRIQKSIDVLKGKMTVVIIAHRLSTIRNVDYIYLLDKGKVLEQGTYQELLNQNNSHFQKMINMQKL